MYKSTVKLHSVICTGKLIKLKFLKKNTKTKIYKTMIRPVVMFSSETWTLTTKDENNLRIFEKQILRKIFGPVNLLAPEFYI